MTIVADDTRAALNDLQGQVHQAIAGARTADAVLELVAAVVQQRWVTHQSLVAQGHDTTAANTALQEILPFKATAIAALKKLEGFLPAVQAQERWCAQWMQALSISNIEEGLPPTEPAGALHNAFCLLRGEWLRCLPPGWIKGMTWQVTRDGNTHFLVGALPLCGKNCGEAATIRQVISLATKVFIEGSPEDHLRMRHECELGDFGAHVHTAFLHSQKPVTPLFPIQTTPSAVPDDPFEQATQGLHAVTQWHNLLHLWMLHPDRHRSTCSVQPEHLPLFDKPDVSAIVVNPDAAIALASHLQHSGYVVTFLPQ